MKNALCVSGILSSIGFVGCAVAPVLAAPTGALSTARAMRDVAALHFKIVRALLDWGAEASAETTTELETKNLPTNLGPSNDQRAFADGGCSCCRGATTVSVRRRYRRTALPRWTALRARIAPA